MWFENIVTSSDDDAETENIKFKDIEVEKLSNVHSGTTVHYSTLLVILKHRQSFMSKRNWISLTKQRISFSYFFDFRGEKAFISTYVMIDLRYWVLLLPSSEVWISTFSSIDRVLDVLFMSTLHQLIESLFVARSHLSFWLNVDHHPSQTTVMAVHIVTLVYVTLLMKSLDIWLFLGPETKRFCHKIQFIVLSLLLCFYFSRLQNRKSNRMGFD